MPRFRQRVSHELKPRPMGGGWEQTAPASPDLERYSRRTCSPNRHPKKTHQLQVKENPSTLVILAKWWLPSILRWDTFSHFWDNFYKQFREMSVRQSPNPRASCYLIMGSFCYPALDGLVAASTPKRARNPDNRAIGLSHACIWHWSCC
jgi:hypothetical protein